MPDPCVILTEQQFFLARHSFYTVKHVTFLTLVCWGNYCWEVLAKLFAVKSVLLDNHPLPRKMVVVVLRGGGGGGKGGGGEGR